ncbi:chromatin remodeling complex Adenosinetriphosphatase [Coemansia sp. RSA 1591]|nr:chromatin remodeling complex Adenosinetriphosphatase [Coemansia sp. RSA 1591]KAJ2441045.1 chromatin remodeling complex Adenosinetriphosphatase [Coemansia sp. RSA 2440]
MQALENHGYGNMDLVKSDIEGKTPEGVEAYAKCNEIQQLLDAKLGECKQDLQWHFCIPYGTGGSTARGCVYTEDEGWFLLVQLAHIGIACEDVYDQIHQEVCLSPLFQFDWFIMSPNTQEI